MVTFEDDHVLAEIRIINAFENANSVGNSPYRSVDYSDLGEDVVVQLSSLTRGLGASRDTLFDSERLGIKNFQVDG